MLFHSIRLTEIILFGADGRRPVYLTVLPIFVLGSLGVSFAQSARQLMLFRVVQAFGGGGGMSVGAGVISDIYRLEERGAAMGLFWPFALPNFWRPRCTLCNLACPATFPGHMRSSFVCSRVDVSTRNKLAAGPWHRQTTRGWRSNRRAVVLVTESTQEYFDPAKPECSYRLGFAPSLIPIVPCWRIRIEREL